MTRDFAETRDGLKIRYEIRGEGPPLALIMGFSGSGRGWGEPLLKLLEARFRTFVIDNRGTGESSKPDREWTLEDMADDIVAVLDHAGVDRAHVFGISMGGMIAQCLALGHPERVARLVLGCTNCGGGHSIAANPEAVAALMPVPGIAAEDQARRAFAAACGKVFLASSEGQAFLDRAISEMGNYPVTPMHTFMRQGEAIGRFDSYDKLPSIRMPTLIFHGDDDAIVPWRNSGILDERLPDSRVHIVRGAGHMFFWESPEEVAETIGAFLAASD